MHITTWPHKAVFEHILRDPNILKIIYHLKIFAVYFNITAWPHKAVFEHILLKTNILKIIYNLKIFSLYHFHHYLSAYYFEHFQHPHSLLSRPHCTSCYTYCTIPMSSKKITILKHFQRIIFSILSIIFLIVPSSLYQLLHILLDPNILKII